MLNTKLNTAKNPYILVFCRHLLLSPPDKMTRKAFDRGDHLISQKVILQLFIIETALKKDELR